MKVIDLSFTIKMFIYLRGGIIEESINAFLTNFVISIHLSIMHFCPALCQSLFSLMTTANNDLERHMHYPDENSLATLLA